MSARRGLAFPLACFMMVLVTYASLHPFTGWVWPTRFSWGMAALPWPFYMDWFDIVLNILGYVPIGFWWMLYGRSARWSWWWAALFALLVGTGWSWLMESTQYLLPTRVPSRMDWLTNSVGTLVGVVLAEVLVRLGGLSLWLKIQARWAFSKDGFALTLLLIWPLALLFPTSIPWGLGHVVWQVWETLIDWTSGTFLEGVLQPTPVAVVPADISLGFEFSVTTLGLLSPILVAFTVIHRPLLRMLMGWSALVVGVVIVSLSTAMNFGPDHALTWASDVTWGAVITVSMLTVVLSLVPVSTRWLALLGMILVSVSLVLNNQNPVDPYVSSSVVSWEQGRYVRFHGLAQWIGWLWPLGAWWQLMRTIFKQRPIVEPPQTSKNRIQSPQ